MLASSKNQDPNNALVTTISLEKEINTFLRLENADVIEQLHKSFPDLPDNPDSKTIFLKLRELRNNW